MHPKLKMTWPLCNQTVNLKTDSKPLYYSVLALIENPVLLSFKAAIANEDSPARYMFNCSLLLTDVKCLFFITDVLWNWTLMVFGVFCQQASPRISRYI